MLNKVGIVGVGLIGGSFALALRDKKLAKTIVGVTKTKASAEKAIALGLVEAIVDLEEAIKTCDFIYVAIPVDSTIPVMQQIMKNIQPHQIAVDAGSTKQALCAAIAAYPNRDRFVPTHPMWGTEYSGPEAAVHNAFAGRSCVIIDNHLSAPDAVEKVEQIYTALGMKLVYMNAADHDLHTAYVSHISHITSFALANTVLEKEKEENTIFDLAGGGFESTVRLAKSDPAMWVPIFKQNKENVLDVLNEHITQLKKFKACLEKENYEYLTQLIEKANTIRKIIE